MTRVPDERTLATPLELPTWSLREQAWISRPTDDQPRVRVLIDNDFAGDPDDLFQLVHHLLSPSVDIRAIICSHDKDVQGRRSADEALRVARDVFRRMGITDTGLLVAGSNDPLIDAHTPRESDAQATILAEASREDPRPLLYVAGGGLTDLASAYLLDPTITERLTVVWIGGLQHDDVVGRAGQFRAEYNRDVDLTAAQLVFAAGFEIWQVPRDQYRLCIMSEAELRQRVARDGGPLGRYLYDEIRHVLDSLVPAIGPAEMYPMGDQPLVLLTALQGVVDETDDFTSNACVTKPTPWIDDDGAYVERPDARHMRVYTRLDHRLMFEDFYAKLGEFAAWQARTHR